VLLAAFRDGAGLITLDDVSGRIGALTNGPVWRGGALYFDGSDDYVQFPTTTVQDGKLFSVLATIRWISGNAYARIVDRTYNNFACWVTSSGQVGFSSTNLGFDQAVSATSLSANTWVRVTWAWNGTTISTYFNGVVSGTVNLSGTGLPVHTNPIRIGNRVDSGSNRTFNGDIESIRIWNRCLQPAEIAAVSAQPYCMFESADAAAFPASGRRRRLLCGAS